MRTKIQSDGKNYLVTIPTEIMERAGFELGQRVEIIADGSTIVLEAVPEKSNDQSCSRLAAQVHTEALELFEGDNVAKDRWMNQPNALIGNRRPSEMLQTKEDIKAVRLLIGRLEHGSLP